MIRWRIDPRHQADVQLALGLTFPAAAGLAFFGWRCLGVWAFIALGAFAARALLHRLRTWTATPGRLSLAVQCGVVGLFCPATLFDFEHVLMRPEARWPALVAVGGFVALADWGRRRLGTRRFHPAAVTAALLTLFLPTLVRTDRVLPPQRAFAGDILSDATADRPTGTAEPWLDAPRGVGRVLVSPPAEASLAAYLGNRPPAGRRNQTVTRLLGDDLPPLEDLVIGGQPTPIGRGSLIIVLIGGLFLVYRKWTPLRVPAMALLACYAATVTLPLPIGAGDGGGRRWLFERDPRVGWAAGLTLVHYLLAAGTLALTSTFLLPQPGVRPGGRRQAAVFATTFGLCAAAATAFVSVAGGALLALVVLQLAWPCGLFSRAERSTSPEAAVGEESFRHEPRP